MCIYSPRSRQRSIHYLLNISTLERHESQKYVSIIIQGSAKIAFEMLFFMVIYIWLFILDRTSPVEGVNDFKKKEKLPHASSPICSQFKSGVRLKEIIPLANRDWPVSTKA